MWDPARRDFAKVKQVTLETAREITKMTESLIKDPALRDYLLKFDESELIFVLYVRAKKFIPPVKSKLRSIPILPNGFLQKASTSCFLSWT